MGTGKRSTASVCDLVTSCGSESHSGRNCAVTAKFSGFAVLDVVALSPESVQPSVVWSGTCLELKSASTHIGGLRPASRPHEYGGNGGHCGNHP